MRINEKLCSNNGKEYLQIEFSHFKNNIICTKILYIDGMTAEEILKAKWEIAEEFCKKNPHFEPKSVYRAYVNADSALMPFYKAIYPTGGYRNGGRKKGSKTDPAKKSLRTESFNNRITVEEKRFLEFCLYEYRINQKDFIKTNKKAWTAYQKSTKITELKQIDSIPGEYDVFEKLDSFIAADERGRKTWCILLNIDDKPIVQKQGQNNPDYIEKISMYRNYLIDYTTEKDCPKWSRITEEQINEFKQRTLI